MYQEDYYSILNVSPTAGLDELKKAYRKLAMQYHPDKQPDAELAYERFRKIREAYEVLSHPQKRQAYHFSRFHSDIPKTDLQNAQNILDELKNITDVANAIGHFRIDYFLLGKQLLEILSPINLLILKAENNPAIRNKIIRQLLQCCTFLDYLISVKITDSIKTILSNEELLSINNFLKIKQRWYYWDKYKIFVAVAIAISICCIIYFLSY
jgi:hypothetical protein